MKTFVSLSACVVLALILVSPAHASTYLLNFSRTSYGPSPWNNWAAWNVPAPGASRSLAGVEGGSSTTTITLTEKVGHLVPWHPSAAPAAETFFGHSIPTADVGETQWTTNDTPGAVGFQLSGLNSTLGYSFQAWLAGSSATAYATDWSITGTAGSSYSSSDHAFGSSSVITPTAAGTIDLRFEFSRSRFAGLSGLAFQESELTTVPEPSSALLLASVLVGAGVLRRRQRSGATR